MEQPLNPSGGARRNEDIALDLLKFVAATSNIGRPITQATGFVAAPSAKPEDQIGHLLDLYARCLQAVSGK